MSEVNGLVSIVIPVYNTGPIIKETIQSVFNQTFENFEIIAIDDGSTDGTIKYLEDIHDPRLKVIQQQNQGMAKTRNNGLAQASGEFVLFLDHDDLLAVDFLSERINCLSLNPDVGFVGGPVHTFPVISEPLMSVADDVEKELLFFLPNYASTPSSYLIRNKTLRENGIAFNTSLSSTADRFFLLQLNKVTRGLRIDRGTLFYRISPGGFSQRISLTLMMDNERLLTEMEKFGLLPTGDLARFRCLYFFMLAGGYRKIGYHRKTFGYLLRSFFASPINFFRRIRPG